MRFDHLIPDEILKSCELDRLDIAVTVTARPCQGRWPRVEIMIDRQTQVIGTVDGELQWHTQGTSENTAVELSIVYHDKTNQDTLVDDQGNILENQCLTLERVTVNGVDLVSTGLIYQFGEYRMDLAPDKLAYYRDNALSTEPSHSLTMWETGVWTVTLPIPVLPALIQRQSRYQPHERWISEDIYQQVYDCIQDIRDLETQLKEKQNADPRISSDQTQAAQD